MGSRISGIVFKSELKQDQVIDLVNQWTESKFELVNKKYGNDMDSIAIGFGKNQLIYLPMDLLYLDYSAITDNALWENRLKEAFILDWFLVFARYDSGDFNGYALYDKSKFVRAAYTTYDGHVFEGEPQDFEKDWLNASVYYEYQDKSGIWYEVEAEHLPEDIGEYHKVLYVGSKDNCESEDYLPLKLASVATEKYVGLDLLYEDDHDTFENSLEFIYFKDNFVIKVEETPKLQTSESAIPWWKFW